MGKNNYISYRFTQKYIQAVRVMCDTGGGGGGGKIPLPVFSGKSGSLSGCKK